MTDFIAEICSNHNGDLDRAIRLVDAAAEAGCAGVKFQLFRLDQLFTPEALAHPDYQHLQQRRAWEMPVSWVPVLSERCRHRKLKFGCTPFHLEAVDQLAPFVDFFKVASYNVLDHRLLAAIAREHKPVMLSTGMATLTEVEEAAGTLLDYGANDLTFLHCISQYPTPLAACNRHFVYSLARLWFTKPDRVRYTLGWSDHTAEPAAIYQFVLGMPYLDVVEFHLDLDMRGHEYNMGHCWLPNEISQVIKTIRMAQIVKASDNRSDYTKSEQEERLWRADPTDGLRPLLEKRKEL